jgi:hypothetical protein
MPCWYRTADHYVVRLFCRIGSVVGLPWCIWSRCLHGDAKNKRDRDTDGARRVAGHYSEDVPERGGRHRDWRDSVRDPWSAGNEKGDCVEVSCGGCRRCRCTRGDRCNSDCRSCCCGILTDPSRDKSRSSRRITVRVSRRREREGEQASCESALGCRGWSVRSE